MRARLASTEAGRVVSHVNRSTGRLLDQPLQPVSLPR
jgi:hypothetical protein